MSVSKIHHNILDLQKTTFQGTTELSSFMRKGPHLIILTVKASITSRKFLFPTIFFFMARKASLGLAVEGAGLKKWSQGHGGQICSCCLELHNQPAKRAMLAPAFSGGNFFGKSEAFGSLRTAASAGGITATGLLLLHHFWTFFWSLGDLSGSAPASGRVAGLPECEKSKKILKRRS